MSVTHGMNVTEVEALGRVLQQSAERLVGITGDLDRLVQVAAWLGDDAGAFLQSWPTHKARMLAASGDLRGFGQSALNNAADQVETSGAGGAFAGPAIDGFALPGFPAGSPTPADIATWWASLAPSQREALIRDDPDRYGNLDGIPPADRYLTNRLRLEDEIAQAEAELANLDAELADRSSAERFLDWAGDRNPLADSNTERAAWLRDRLTRLREADDPTAQIWFFDPAGDGRIGQVFGDLTTADNVAVVVPGITNDIHNFDSVRTNAWNLEQAMHRAHPGSSHATIAWLGYDTPDDIAAGGSGDAANDGFGALQSSVAEIDRVNDDGRVSVVAHSYGSLVTGRAMQDGLGVDRVAVVGSPGMGGFGSNDRSDLGSPDVELYAGTHQWDIVPFAPTHGEDPSAEGFGSTRFETDVSGHSSYFNQGSRSLDNLARIAVGLEPR